MDKKLEQALLVFSRAITQQLGLGRNTRKGMQSLIGTAARLTITIGMLTTVGKGLLTLYSRTEKNQKASLALGTSLKGVRDVSQELIDSIPTDELTILEEKIAFLTDGIRDNNLAATNLAVRMKLTGQDSSVLRKAIIDNSIVNGLNNDKTTQLAKSVEQSSITYKTKTEDLLAAFSDLTQSLEIPGLLGFGQSIATAGADLAGQLGAGFSKISNKFVKELLNPDNIPQLAMMGVLDTVKKMQDVTMTADDELKLIKSAAVDINKFLQQNVYTTMNNGMGQLANTNLKLNALGTKNFIVATQLINVLKGQSKATLDSIKSEEDYTQSIEGFTNKIKIFQDLAINTFTPLLKTLNTLTPAIQGLTVAITTKGIGEGVMSLSHFLGNGTLATGVGLLGKGLVRFAGIAGLIYTAYDLVSKLYEVNSAPNPAMEAVNTQNQNNVNSSMLNTGMYGSQIDIMERQTKALEEIRDFSRKSFQKEQLPNVKPKF